SKALNGGYGLLLDGSHEKDEIIKSAMMWDVMGGVSRRAWARNDHAIETCALFNEEGLGHLTLPFLTDEKRIDELVKRRHDKGGK
ncbi:MAG: urocanate hydratase, partial [Candidatus Izemoplasmataceae bacterium]